MWMKTAAHRLRKWVPTSAEYMREQLRIVAGVQAEQGAPAASVRPAAPEVTLTADDFRQLADDAADMGELSQVLKRAQGAGFATGGDELFQHFLARRAALETPDADEVAEPCLHDGEFDPQCPGCRAAQTAADQRLAAA